MNSDYLNISSLTGDYIRSFFRKRQTKCFTFHNIAHTLNVVKAAQKIGRAERISSTQMLIITLAAYFHDTGYFKDMHDHEEASKQTASAFLNRHGLREDLLSYVLQCIDATRLPQNPKSSLERILCDADLYHLAQENLLESTLKLHSEWKDCKHNNLLKSEYLQATVEFMESHRYCTRYAREKLKKKKHKNIHLLQL